MSEQRFLELLQSLLTMADPKKPETVGYVKSVLENLWKLLNSSGMFDRRTFRMIHNAIDSIDELIDIRNDFAGTPGDIAGNRAKRQRLRDMLAPAC